VKDKDKKKRVYRSKDMWNIFEQPRLVSFWIKAVLQTGEGVDQRFGMREMRRAKERSEEGEK